MAPTGAQKASVDAEWTFAPGANSLLFPLSYSDALGLLLVANELPAQIYALDPGTGRAVWTVDTGSQSAQAFYTTAGTVIAVMGSSSVADYMQGYLGVWALSSGDGRVLWTTRLGPQAQVLGLSGDSLVARDAGGITAISVATGSVRWTDGPPSGCSDVAAAAGSDRIEVAQQCSRLLRLIAIDPATGEPLWATVLSSAFQARSVMVTAALYGRDGVVTLDPGSETLISPGGSPLAEIPLGPEVVEDQWGLDGSGNLVRVEQDQAAVSLQEFDPATGARLRQWSVRDPLSQATWTVTVNADSFGVDTYVLANLPAPLVPAGLVVFDRAASRSTLFPLPMAASSVVGLTAGPHDVYVTYLTRQRAGTGLLVAYSRAALDSTGTPSTPVARNWPQACGVLPAQRLSSLTGHPYAGYGQAVRGGSLPPASTCLYATTAPGQPGLEVDVGWDGTSDAATAALTAQVASYEGFRVTPVANLGDQAYELVQNEPGVTETCEVVLRVGTVLVLVKSSKSTTLASAIAPAIAADLAAREGR